MVGAEIPHDVDIPEGAYGIFQCPALGTDSPLYKTEAGSQRVVDDENSANIIHFGQGYAILDHVGSEVDGGIWNVNEMTVGGSAFLIKADKIMRYECTTIMKCYSDGFKFISDFDSRNVKPREKNDLICVSCAVPDGSEVYVAYYKFVMIEP